MRWKILVGVVLASALVVPAAPALAEGRAVPGAASKAAATCATVVYKDIRGLVTVDLDTASDTQVRILATQMLSAATTEGLTYLPDRVQAALDGTAADLRAFLKTGWQPVWTTDLRIAVVRTLASGKTNVQTAAQSALDTGTVDAYLAFLDHGWYAARAKDAGSYKAYADIRTLVTIDLDTASDTQVRILANQILSVATTEALTYLPARIQAGLDGTPDALRALLKSGWQSSWSTDLRIAVNRALASGGTNVKNAAQAALDNGSVDALLTFLDDGIYIARAADCAI